MKKKRQLPDIEYLQECLTYESLTGILIWKERPRVHFRTLVAKDRWNRMYAGQDAGRILGTGLTINVQECSYPLAAVAYKLHTNKEPHLIGHKDKRRGNLAFDNLINFKELADYNAQCLPTSKYVPGTSIEVVPTNTDLGTIHQVIAGTHLFVIRSTQEQAEAEVSYLKEKLL